MRLRLKTLCVATVLVAAGIGGANATIVTNGDFSQISTSTGVNGATPSQLNYPTGFFASYGEFVTGWTTTGPLLSQNVVWVPNATAAWNTNAADVDTIFPFGPRPLFPKSVQAAPDNDAFLAIQANLPDSGIQQSVSGLTQGDTYTVSFWWAATMDNIDTAVETAQLTASIDGTSHPTDVETVSSNGGFLGGHSEPTFSGWIQESFQFTASGTSSLLTFIADGTPAGLPPYALLTGVTIDQVAVPEPPEFAIFGGGLLALGFLTVAARRRALRDRKSDGAAA